MNFDSMWIQEHSNVRFCNFHKAGLTLVSNQLLLCTCIFIATSLPSGRTPRCTWPIEAAAKGLSWNDNNMSFQPGPNSSSRTFYKHDMTQTHTSHWNTKKRKMIIQKYLNILKILNACCWNSGTRYVLSVVYSLVLNMHRQLTFSIYFTNLTHHIFCNYISSGVLNPSPLHLEVSPTADAPKELGQGRWG